MGATSSKYKPLYTSTDPLIIVTGGRGSGKSHAVSECDCRTTLQKGNKTLYTRYTLSSAHISIIPEYRQKLEILGIENYCEITKDSIINNLTGSSVLFKGIKTSSGNQTANLKSVKDPNRWILDEAEEMPSYELFQKIKRSIRKKGVFNQTVLVLNPCHYSHWIPQTFFEPNKIPNGFNGSVDGITYIHTTYLDNLTNLDDSFLSDAEKTKERNLIEYEHVFLGHWAKDAINALWKQSMIDRTRVYDLVDFKKVVIAVDPSVTGNSTSDECGIVAVAKGIDNELYVLEDCSGIMTPNQWANKVCYLYDKWGANCVVAEVNNGGDLVKSVINNINPSIKVVDVRATKGKQKRAEPIVQLYEQKMVHHLNYLKSLEYEMTTWSEDSNVSPNRIDALVWGLTYLNEIKTTKIIWS